MPRSNDERGLFRQREPAPQAIPDSDVGWSLRSRALRLESDWSQAFAHAPISAGDPRLATRDNQSSNTRDARFRCASCRLDIRRRSSIAESSEAGLTRSTRRPTHRPGRAHAPTASRRPHDVTSAGCGRRLEGGAVPRRLRGQRNLRAGPSQSNDDLNYVRAERCCLRTHAMACPTCSGPMIELAYTPRHPMPTRWTATASTVTRRAMACRRVWKSARAAVDAAQLGLTYLHRNYQ